MFSDESSESLVSVRSDENISIKGSPVKKATVVDTYAVSSSEPFEVNTNEVCIQSYNHTHTILLLEVYIEGVEHTW